MIQFIVSTLVILAFFISLYGWGRLVSKFIYPEDVRCWPYSVTLGLASWILLGGILNVIHLAYPVMLYAIFGLGVLLSLVFGFSWIPKAQLANWAWLHQGEFLVPFSRTNLLSYGLPLPLALVAVAFLVATLLPGNVFNFHDDFHTYFVRPVRMLQTGTVGGDPFDVLGLDSLGSLAFLQSFVVASFPITYINGFDAIFCFALYVFLLIEVARYLQIHWVYVISPLLVFVVINPQYVNVSALYSGSVLILALIFASHLLCKSDESRDLKSSLKMTIPVGVFLSCLISLKVTFVLYAVIYFLTYFGLSILFGADRKRNAIITVFSALIVIVATTPWIAVHLPNYSMHLSLASAESAGMNNSTNFFVRLMSFNFSDTWTLLSFDRLFWGGRYFDYSFVVAMLALASVISIYLLKSRKRETREHDLLPVFSSCIGAILVYFVNVNIFSLQSGLRYSCPVLIGSLPAALLLLGQYTLRDPGASQASVNRLSMVSRLGVLLLVLQGVLIALFSNVFLERVGRAYSAQTLISFPINKRYVRYNKAALGSEARKWVLGFQSNTEEGKTILAWMSVPFRFDFGRNRVLTVMEPGLINPWLNISSDESPETLGDYIRQLGIRYVVWEHKGYGMKSIRVLSAQGSPRSRVVRNHIYLRETLNVLAERGKILYGDDRIVVIDMGEG